MGENQFSPTVKPSSFESLSHGPDSPITLLSFSFFHSVGQTLTSYPPTTFCMLTTCEQAHYISLYELVASSMAGKSGLKSQRRRGQSLISRPGKLRTSEISMPLLVSSAVTHHCHHRPALPFRDWYPFTKLVLILHEESTANPTWGDIFECCFKAHSSKLEGLFSLKRGKREVQAFSLEISKLTPQVEVAVAQLLCLGVSPFCTPPKNRQIALWPSTNGRVFTF